MAMADKTALLAFTIGPVQTFIDKARTVRDLWTGSFLLSYLTAKALDVGCRAGDDVTLITPTLPAGKIATEALFTKLEAPSLPNRFVLQGPQPKLDELKVACRQQCLEAWWELCAAVHGELDARIRKFVHSADWDRLWVSQVGFRDDDDFSRLFDIRLTLLPASVTDETVDAVLSPARRCKEGTEEDRRWTDRLELLQQLQASEKIRRFVPDYRPAADTGQWPPKCSLLGSYEQLGPSELKDSREFWEALAADLSIGGTRVRGSERLCAVSMVKRFAWPTKLAQEADEAARRLRYEDTATVAAAAWFELVKKEDIDLDPAEIIAGGDEWNGHWLHWKTREEDRDELSCPTDVFRKIEQARRACGPPPIYYAIMMLDGDDMGRAFRNAAGCDAHQELSSGISNFAREQVGESVKNHHGQLIYCGGDDVLAMLPTATAIPCSQEISSRFRKAWREGGLEKYGAGTVSAGLAIVHYKEDLRFAIQAARKAEAAAKGAGKNTLALSVCRRSGEHSTAICPWDYVDRLTNLVTAFLSERQGGSGISDRWAYHLAAELPTLEILHAVDAVTAEIARQIKRSEPATRARLQGGETFATAFPDYCKSLPKPSSLAAEKHASCRHAQQDGSHEAKVRRDFVKLCQAASFLARGRDES